MKVVLFCGGAGTRIRDLSERVPKPLIPIGNQPVVWHVMDYYNRFGHQDFVLCLGYKAPMFRSVFLENRFHNFGNCVISAHGTRVESLEPHDQDWRVTLIDTGLSSSIGHRLLQVRKQVDGEDIFLANYSDGLCDVDLDRMVRAFERSGKVACFLAVRPPVSFHFASIGEGGDLMAIRASDDMDIWINGGYFIFRQEIFDHMRPGEDLVPDVFDRLAREGRIMAYKHETFWRAMDTLKDHQVLEDLVQSGRAPWQVDVSGMRDRFVRELASL